MDIYITNKQVYANSNLDAYFSSGLEQVTQVSPETWIYLFSTSYFTSNNTNESFNHTIEFKTNDNLYEK